MMDVVTGEGIILGRKSLRESGHHKRAPHIEGSERIAMLPYADLVLYDHLGRLIAVAEIKNKRGTSGDWAAKLRRNILAHGGFPHVDFYLIITPDRLYLWKGAGEQPDLIQPTYEIDAQPIFKAYLERAGVAPGDVSGGAFELLVESWLSDLMSSEKPVDQFANGEKWLVESSFLGAVKDGRIESVNEHSTTSVR